MSAGKGDAPRPLSVDAQTFTANWSRTFARLLIVCVYYDRPRMVRNALESVKRQTDDRWHLAFIDDGSTVPGEPIVREIFGDDPRVTCYRIEDTAAAKLARDGSTHPAWMNRAIRECPGDLVIILCDDDALHEDVTHNVVRWFDEHPEAVYGYGYVKRFDPFVETPHDGLPYDQDLCRHRDAIRPSCQVDSTQVVYRASTHREDGITYPEVKTTDLDAAIYDSLFERYGSCPIMKLSGHTIVTQYKGRHDDQMGRRPEAARYVARDCA